MARVLIGTDGSGIASQAAATAIDLLGPAAHDVTVVQVVPSNVPMIATVGGLGTSAVVIDDHLAARSRQAVIEEVEADLLASLARLGVAGTIYVAVGDPGVELCRLAAEGPYDVLVVGSHGSGFLRRVLLGSVSHYVLHHAPCAVLVVRAVDHGEQS